MQWRRLRRLCCGPVPFPPDSISSQHKHDSTYRQNNIFGIAITKSIVITISQQNLAKWVNCMYGVKCSRMCWECRVWTRRWCRKAAVFNSLQNGASLHRAKASACNNQHMSTYLSVALVTQLHPKSLTDYSNASAGYIWFNPSVSHQPHAQPSGGLVMPCHHSGIGWNSAF